MDVPITVVLQIVLPLVAVATMWGAINSKLTQVVDVQKDMRAKQEDQGRSIHAIEIQITELKGKEDRADRTGAHRPLANLQKNS